jgi:hypothetical protein
MESKIAPSDVGLFALTRCDNCAAAVLGDAIMSGKTGAKILAFFESK